MSNQTTKEQVNSGRTGQNNKTNETIFWNNEQDNK